MTEYYQDLLRFAKTFVSQDAEDLVQETYYRAIKHKKSFKGGNKKAWLFTILRNEYFSEYHKKMKDLKLRDERNLTVELEHGISDNLYDSLNKNEHKQIVLLYKDGFKYEEIAEILAIPLGTVKSRFHRIRQTMRDDLKEYE